jgi:uncharacterized membrane protein SpoIIM required for sporulation
MILDSDRFIARESPHWEALREKLDKLDMQSAGSSGPEALLELHSLYRRAASGLTRLEAAAADPAVIDDLGALVGRAYAEIHSRPRTWTWKSLPLWIFTAFPVAFRRHFRYFAAAVWITLAGALVGGLAIAADKENRETLYPFPHLLQDPSKRVAQEEQAASEKNPGAYNTFAASLMANNIRVTINAFALGMLYGIGTVILLFYNGAILGGVAVDYIADGQLVFLLAWLLPHGVTELPAIFIGGMAGLLVARTLFGFGDRRGLRARFRDIIPDLAALLFGAATLLVWAGIVESFFSQHHEPVISYTMKIAFGLVELAVLVFWLARAGRSTDHGAATAPGTQPRLPA